jgi:hypothetical protein
MYTVVFVIVLDGGHDRSLSDMLQPERILREDFFLASGSLTGFIVCFGFGILRDLRKKNES